MLCPPYLADNISFAIDNPAVSYPAVSSGQETSLADVYINAGIPSNPDVSAECSTADAQTYCLGAYPSGSPLAGQPYCPDPACTVDRRTSGPFYCAISDISNQYADLPNNTQLCNACATDGSNHELGPQCQVYLQHGNDAGILPQGCSSSCAPTTTDPKPAQPSCDGFCYPRLKVPTSADSSSCGDYLSSGNGNANRTVANAAACPIACRYDYQTAGGAQVPDTAAQTCGTQDGNGWTNGIQNAHECDGTCGGVISQNDKNYCVGESYSCSQTGPAGSYWVRATRIVSGTGNCQKNVVAYVADSCDTYKKGDKICGDAKKIATNDWFVDLCSLSSAAFKQPAADNPYTCAAQHKFAGIDSMVGAAIGRTYYQCGELNPPNGPNPDDNFCGSVTVGSTTVSALAPECLAQYNARAAACLPYSSYIRDMGTSSQPIPASGNCQQCPLFCRIDDPSFVCDPTAGGVAPVCGAPTGDGSFVPDPSTCDIANQLNPAGYCGLSMSDFKIGSQCVKPTVGSGVGCPARCRLRMPDGSLPAGCTGGDIGQACASIDDACRASPSANPCQTCAQCQQDCQALPYVRQNCDELCQPSDLSAGASNLAPSQLLSSFSGAAGNPLWNSLGSLAIAAIILPIFAIIFTIAFIRSLSPLLGGDIEIPGLLKLI
ncbi:MAG: hypothetical protein KGH63_01705 [Candidatus Micrarchaeota archaeon]|nr:hypothetical protein [Candidatus Micrarchaeota archaeon]